MTDPSALPTKHQRFARRAARLVRLGLFTYVGLIVVLWWLQEKLIFPGSVMQGHSWTRIEPGPDAELVALELADGTPFVVLYGAASRQDGTTPPDPATCPTLLFFYGNGSNVKDMRDIFDWFRHLSLNVAIVEYPGYGMSGGRPGEASFAEAADRALDHLRGRPEIDAGTIVVGGWSLGGAVALSLAARHPDAVAGAFTLNTFTSMIDMAQQKYPIVPVRWLLRHRFDSLSAIVQAKCPVLLGHGDRDPIIPSAMSERLAAASSGPARSFVIPGSHHNDIFDTNAALIARELGDWLETTGIRRPAGSTAVAASIP